jgi:hypothetical protein
MGMKNAQVATCPQCDKINVLCCSKCGYCADCDNHSFCENEDGGMKDPKIASCPCCGKANVLCCSSCGYCGDDDTHSSC